MARNAATSRSQQGGPARAATAVDAYVAERVRLRRLLLGMSQERLASSVGVSPQQIQHYERGSSRLFTATLHAFARALGVPTTYFFEGLPGLVDDPQARAPAAREQGRIDALDPYRDGRTQKETRALIRAYDRIAHPRDRRTILDLAKRLAATGR